MVKWRCGKCGHSQELEIVSGPERYVKILYCPTCGAPRENGESPEPKRAEMVNGENTANTNCLEGMACPACSSQGPFDIAVECCAVVTDDGPTEESGFSWNDDSNCDCRECAYEGEVRNFKT